MTPNLSIPDQLASPFDVQPLGPWEWELPGTSDSPLDNGDFPAAFLRGARSDTDRHPDLAIAWARRAQAAQVANQPGEAVNAATRAIELGVGQASAPATHAATVVLSAVKCSAPVRRALDDPRAAELPSDVPLRMAIEVRDLDKAAELSEGQTSAESHTLAAWVALEQRDFRKAIAASRQARRAGASGPVLLTNLGFAHAALGNLREAIRVTREAAVLSPFDRTIGFNLASFHRSIGDFDGAIAVLDKLKTSADPDFQLALALSDVTAEAGDLERARRILQRVRTSQEWAHAETVRRCELEANLALLRVRTKRTDGASATAAVLEALRNSDYRSVAIAYILLNLLDNPAAAHTLAKVLDSLQSEHREASLYPLRMHLAVLRRDPTEAVRWAKAWSDEDVLNTTAASAAIHLLADLAGRPDEAAELGLMAVRRHPANPYLVNNTAYALCLADRPQEALRLLDRRLAGTYPAVVSTATRALAQLTSGEIAPGIAGYRRARALAEEEGNDALAMLVDINLVLALHRVSPDETGRIPEGNRPTQVPHDWARRIDFWITAQRAARELGARVEETFPGLTTDESAGKR